MPTSRSVFRNGRPESEARRQPQWPALGIIGGADSLVGALWATGSPGPALHSKNEVPVGPGRPARGPAADQGVRPTIWAGTRNWENEPPATPWAEESANSIGGKIARPRPRPQTTPAATPPASSSRASDWPTRKPRRPTPAREL